MAHLTADPENPPRRGTQTEVDGRIRGATSAYPGGLNGQTLGDITGRTEPIVARISVVDGGDFVLQTTGNIELTPPTN